jgi:hypothetical protein
VLLVQPEQLVEFRLVQVAELWRQLVRHRHLNSIQLPLWPQPQPHHPWLQFDLLLGLEQFQ